MSGLQKLALSVFVIALLVAGYFFYQSGAATSISVTLNTNPDLNRGLVGHWTFDGPDFTDRVYDTSGQGNHGYVEGTATSSVKTVGKIGQGVRFDGLNDDIKINSSSLNNLSPVTYSVWIKPDSFGPNNDTIIDKTSNFTNGCCSLRGIWQTGYMELTNIFANNSLVQRVTNEAVPLNQWTHVVATADGTANGSGIHIYFNGVEQTYFSTSNANGSPGDDSPYSLNIGGYDINAAFKGAIDDVRIYNRALSAAEVKRLYQVGATTKVDQTLNTNPDLNRGLVGHWTFDGPDMDLSNPSTGVRDSSGNGYHAANNHATPTLGVIGQAISTETINGSGYVNLSDPTLLANLSPLSVSAWIKVGAFKSGQTSAFIDKGVVGGGWYVEYGETGSICLQVGFAVTTAYRCTPSGTLALNQWIHITATWDGTTNGSGIHIYANGVDVSNGFWQDGSGSHNTDVSEILTFGFYQTSAAFDDVRVYNRVLSAAEAKRLYEIGATTKVGQTQNTNPDLNRGLVGHWTFDGPDMNWSNGSAEVRDTSGQGNHGDAAVEMSNKKSNRTGVIGQGLHFVEADYSTVDLGNAASLQITGSMSVSTWARFDSFKTGTMDDDMVTKSDNGPGISWQFKASEDCGAQHLQFDVSSDGTNSTAQRCSSTVLTTDTWYHFAGVYNASAQTLDVYVNGVLDNGTLLGTVPASIFNTSTNADMGGRSNGADFTGTLDDMRIYNRALSAAEVKRLYDLGR